jgi:hypothetical protein
MPRYLVLIAYRLDDWANAGAEEQQAYTDGHVAFHRFVDARGRRISGSALADAATATTIRHTADTAMVSDGPFVELAEQIGGYYDIELPDLDTAIAAARLLPAAYTVEIRPTIDIEVPD